MFRQSDGRDEVLDFQPGVNRIEIGGGLLGVAHSVDEMLDAVALPDALLLDLGKEQLTIAGVTDLTALKGGPFIVWARADVVGTNACHGKPEWVTPGIRRLRDLLQAATSRATCPYSSAGRASDL